MKRILIVVVLFLNQFSSYAISGDEKKVVRKFDEYVINMVSKKRFNKYFRFSSLYFYQELPNGKLLAPKDVTDPGITEISCRYVLTIPELCYEYTIVVIWNKKREIFWINNSSYVPNYILKNTRIDLLNKRQIQKILSNKESNSHFEIVNCSYDKNLGLFTWGVLGYSSAKCAELNCNHDEYIFDAHNGNLIKTLYNVPPLIVK